MSFLFRVFRFQVCWLLLLTHLTSKSATADPVDAGLYARFNTSHGVFWCRLEFEKTPRTVANFISLAEGTREWIDFAGPGIARRKFYDGLIFHRVIKGFMIQGGSPNGLGTDGPGYRFKDEFHPELRHSKGGILSMANSGPHTQTNGSQFFVTLAETPWLNDVHSVFGEVVEGFDIVESIGSVSVTAEDRPIVPVFMNEITIERIGVAAEGFVPEAADPPLPSVGSVQSTLNFSGDDLHLNFTVNTDRIHYAFFSPDLADWKFQGFDPRSGTISPLLATGILTSQPRQFFMILNGGFE